MKSLITNYLDKGSYFAQAEELLSISITILARPELHSGSRYYRNWR
jgi:hypothetical protein